MPVFYEIQISEKQKQRLIVALREFNNAHPELPVDDYLELDTDHPKSLADMLENCQADGLNCLTM